MSDERTPQKTLEDQLATRNRVISEYGHLWRQAIAKSIVNDEKTIAELLQVCAACYLDGVRQGALSGIEMFIEEQRIRDRATFILAQDAALTEQEACQQARKEIDVENKLRK
jgi:hypothetical protein